VRKRAWIWIGLTAISAGCASSEPAIPDWARQSPEMEAWYRETSRRWSQTTAEQQKRMAEANKGKDPASLLTFTSDGSAPSSPGGKSERRADSLSQPRTAPKQAQTPPTGRPLPWWFQQQ